MSKKSRSLPTWYLRSSFPGKPKYFSAGAEPSNRRGDKKKQDRWKKKTPHYMFMKSLSIILMIFVTLCSPDRDDVKRLWEGGAPPETIQ